MLLFLCPIPSSFLPHAAIGGHCHISCDTLFLCHSCIVLHKEDSFTPMASIPMTESILDKEASLL